MREMTPAETTLLLVEDDPSNLESLERLCAKEGYRVLTAPDGGEELCARLGVRFGPLAD